MQRLPVVYVRGFAGERGVEEAVEDPFYGFNKGSAHVRVGGSGDPVFHQFESPLVRLMVDYDYELVVRGDQRRVLEEADPGELPPASIWVHRFYDTSAASLTERPEEFRLEDAAEDLGEVIRLIKRATGAPRVLLVAHSMGGLICRALIQKILPDARGRQQATDHVDRLFTYGTPHGGIQFAKGFGLLERLRDALDIEGGAIFGPERMYEYLTPEDEQVAEGPPQGWRSEVLPAERFPLDRVCCLVGTNPTDYGAAMGLSSKAVGPRSDGLVQIDAAQVPGAHRAFVHRSHSGRYGMVNSEEGYQNLRRFLFGDLEVTAELVGLSLPREDELVWQAEARLAVRGLPILMHEQVASHWCPIQLDPGEGAVPLVTTFLSSEERPRDADHARYSLQVRVLSLRETPRGMFDFGHHLERTADFDDMLIVDVQPGEAEAGFPRAWARWNSTIPTALRDYTPEGPPLTDEDPDVGEWRATIPLPVGTAAFLGEQAAVRLTVRARHSLGQDG